MPQAARNDGGDGNDGKTFVTTGWANFAIIMTLFATVSETTQWQRIFSEYARKSLHT